MNMLEALNTLVSIIHPSVVTWYTRGCGLCTTRASLAMYIHCSLELDFCLDLSLVHTDFLRSVAFTFFHG